jgi:cell division protein FtsL
MKKFFSFLRKPKAKPNSRPRNRVLTATEIAAQEEQKRKLAEQQAKAAFRKKAQRTAKAAKPRNRILKESESATTGARPTRTRWFKRRKQRSPQERAARRTQNSIGPIVRDILSGEFLTREGVTRHIPYLIIVSVMFIAYIAMGYQFERLEREKLQTKRQLEELSAEYKTLKAEFETQLQQSTVEQNIAELASGLNRASNPSLLRADRFTHPTEASWQPRYQSLMCVGTAKAKPSIGTTSTAS